MSWISPRIWRTPSSRFNDDEPLNCTQNYTPEILRGIRDQGFDAIWLRGRLRELIRSKIYPELNDEKAPQRIASLQKVIRDGRDLGVKVFLYFNEPLALPRTHEFWKRHPEVVGEPHCEKELGEDVLSFCTSTKDVQDFLCESVRNLFDELTGLGGVILITASEYQTHCWSHRARRKIGDAYLDRCLVDVECPNCRDREPADVVSEIIRLWADQAAKTKPAPEVWAWNWSWSIWYDHPLRDIIRKLPKGAKLLCDFERGGTRKQEIGQVSIDEYSLGYPGPSQQFVDSISTGKEYGLLGCAKLQLGTTHELATVPNLPLIPNLFEKLRTIDRMKLAGVMGSWNFGNSLTLNTAAFRLFVMRENLREDEEGFLETLAKEYFSVSDPHNVVLAWKAFCRAFGEYPFSTNFLYFSPMNYAVAYPLKCAYEDRPMEPSWILRRPFGDRLEDCMGPFTLTQMQHSLARMEKYWRAGLDFYRSSIGRNENPHQKEEMACAEIIGCHISALGTIFDFHAWRREEMKNRGLDGPCILPLARRARAILERQLETMQEALEFTRADSRFGYHQEPCERFYDFQSVSACIEQIQGQLAH